MSDDPDDNPFIAISRSLRGISPAQQNAVVRSMLSHFGAFSVGGAIGVGVFSDEVNDTVCSFAPISTGMNVPRHCEYLAGLSWKMQVGLAAIAVFTLVTSEVVDRRRYRRRDDE